ncbi:MAG: cation:proton antiporter [Syntrophothermus sp.]
MKLSAEQLTSFLVGISVMLLAAKLLGELFGKMRQPAIIGEILAGIILGPTILGTLAPGFSAFLFPQAPPITAAMDGITSLAVIMLLLVLGLEVDLSVVVRQSRTALSTSIMGIIFPFSVGFTLAWLFPDLLGIKDANMHLAFSLFIGTAMSISALPVIARTLLDLNIFRTDVGLIILASAMFDDLVGWIIFSVVLGMMGAGGHGFSFPEKITMVLAFVAVMLIFVRKIINRIFPFIQNKFSYPGGVLNFIFILGFLCAAFTEYIGIHAIFGAFIVGITIGDTAHLKEKTREIVHQFVTNIFAPIFFVSIGMRVNFITNFDGVLLLLILVLAFTGKVIGCGLGALWSGMNRTDSAIIGFGMNSRGAMEIILGLLALQHGLIQEKVFVALVIMALFTSLSSGPVMNYFLKRKQKPALRDLIEKQFIITSSAPDKETVIRDLVHLVSEKNRLNEKAIFDKVWAREQLLPSGIANHLAIPHARADIKRPVIAVAVHKDGLDFDAADGLVSKIIVLLITPAGAHEVQLQLLAEIADKFKEAQKVADSLTLDGPDKIISRLILDAG